MPQETPLHSPVAALGAFEALAVGLAIVVGTAGMYYHEVERPKGWPRADGVVLSSAVVNATTDATLYEPKVVVRFRYRGIIRELTASAAFQSPSYDEVQAHVARYPPGATVELAVNENADDVRYELGATTRMLVQTGTLGLAGLIITGIGVRQMRGRRLFADRAAAQRYERRAAHWRASGLIVGGLAAGATGAWLLASRDTPSEWPTVDAEVVTSGVAPEKGSSAPLGGTHDILVSFRYVVNDVQYVSTAVSGNTTRSFESAKLRVERFAGGSKHRISYRPDAPNVIAFDVPERDSDFIPFAVALLSPVLLIAGVVTWRKRGGDQDPPLA